MKDPVYRVEYFAFTVDDRPGTGGDLGRRFKDESLNLIALSAFPIGGGRTQVDIVPEQPDTFLKIVRKLGLTVSEPRVAFLIQGADRIGGLGEVLARLGAANINVRATTGVSAGANRYGAILWVNQQDVELASRALGATNMVAHHV
jgi:hypothetical protein